MKKLMQGIFSLPWIAVAIAAAASPPGVGDKAADFTLEALRGGQVQLSDLTAQGPVVLVVLRGYPGYQCPLCNRQAHDFLENAKAFAGAGVPVVMVYPGPSDKLKQRAAEFARDKSFPENFHLLLDPGYEFTNLYELRWEAPGETAYPATFLIDAGGEIFFARISNSHGDRTKASDILVELAKRKGGS